MSKEFVCPQPKVWNDIHKALLNEREHSDNSTIPEPPIPLILAGWWESTDDDKRERWRDTIHWAEQYGFDNVIPTLTDNDCYFG